MHSGSLPIGHARDASRFGDSRHDEIRRDVTAKWTRADGTRSPWVPIPAKNDPPIARDDEAGARAYAASLAPQVKSAGAGGGSVERVEAYAARWLADREGRIASIEADRARMRIHVLSKDRPPRRAHVR